MFALNHVRILLLKSSGRLARHVEVGGEVGAFCALKRHYSICVQKPHPKCRCLLTGTVEISYPVGVHIYVML
jgi:hypothetical protein